MIDKSTLSTLAKEAYATIFNQSEDRVVSDALAKFSDQEDQEDYIESYLVIFQKGWVNFMAFRGAFNAHLGENDKLSLLQLEDLLRDEYQIRTVQNSTVGTAYKYIRPIEGHEDDILPEELDAEVEVQIKVPTLSDTERQHFVSVISRVVSESPDQTMLMAKLGPVLDEELHYKSMGFPRLRDLLDQFQEDFDICEDANGAKCVCLKGTPLPDVPVKAKPSPRFEEAAAAVPNVSGGIPVADVLKVIGDMSMAQHGNQNGWVNVVYVQPALKRSNIDYKQLGFKKLRQFLESLGTLVEFDQVSPTELMVRVGDGASSSVNGTVLPVNGAVRPANGAKQPVKTTVESPFEKMVGFAFFPPKKDGTNGFSAMLKELENKCLDENWEFEGQKILQNYLLFTFERILFEDERSLKQGRPKDCLKLKKGKRYAVFNTGLVNSYYSQVYALFKSANPSMTKPWVFEGFHTEEEPRMSAVRKDEGWFDLPAAARFYDSLEDIVYDVTYHIDAVNWEHIIIDNVERIPTEYVRQNSPQHFVVEDDPEKPMEYYDRLRAAIKEDDFCYRKMVKLFTDAMDRSLKHVKWNFHYALPMYYPRRHKISMLLPLNLGDTRDNKADLALVLERDSASHTYIATTIMTLQQVYCNVRLITKIDDSSNWLKPAK